MAEAKKWIVVWDRWTLLLSRQTIRHAAYYLCGVHIWLSLSKQNFWNIVCIDFYFSNVIYDCGDRLPSSPTMTYLVCILKSPRRKRTTDKTIREDACCLFFDGTDLTQNAILCSGSPLCFWVLFFLQADGMELLHDNDGGHSVEKELHLKNDGCRRS